MCIWNSLTAKTCREVGWVLNTHPKLHGRVYDRTYYCTITIIGRPMNMKNPPQHQQRAFIANTAPRYKHQITTSTVIAGCTNYILNPPAISSLLGLFKSEVHCHRSTQNPPKIGGVVVSDHETPRLQEGTARPTKRKSRPLMGTLERCAGLLARSSSRSSRSSGSSPRSLEA